MGWVGLGLHLEFHAGDQWIITSHVRAIAVEPSMAGAPCSGILPRRARARCEALGPRATPLWKSGTTDPLTMRTCAVYGHSRARLGAVSTSDRDDGRRPRVHARRHRATAPESGQQPPGTPGLPVAHRLPHFRLRSAGPVA